MLDKYPKEKKWCIEFHLNLALTNFLCAELNLSCFEITASCFLFSLPILTLECSPFLSPVILVNSFGSRDKFLECFCFVRFSAEKLVTFSLLLLVSEIYLDLDE